MGAHSDTVISNIVKGFGDPESPPVTETVPISKGAPFGVSFPGLTCKL